MANLPISLLPERTYSNIVGTEEAAFQTGGTTNYRISLNSIKAWLREQYTTFVTLAGTQTLTNKTLTSPVINSGDAVTVTGTTINHLTGTTTNLNTRIGAVEADVDTLDSTVDGIDTRLTTVEGEIEYTFSMSAGAAGTSVTIATTAIEALLPIDVDSVLCQYYEVNTLVRTGMLTDKIVVHEKGGAHAGKLDKIIFATETGHTYHFIIKYKLYTA
jgi:hypothetical protein